MNLSDFAGVFALLAVQLRATDADEATIRSYFAALKDLEFPLVRDAADKLSKTAEWFPKTSEWRTAVEALRHERIEAQRAYLRTAPRPLCACCEDTGWEARAGIEKGRAVRRVAPCRCRETRRQELLGLVPFPALPPAEGEPDLTQEATVHAMASRLARRERGR